MDNLDKNIIYNKNNTIYNINSVHKIRIICKGCKQD